MSIYRGTGGANEATDLATNQAVLAQQSAEQAANSATQAAQTFSQFSDIYLGDFAVAPTTDNQGEPLQVGAIYFDTDDKLLKIWDGVQWLVSAVSEPSSFARNTYSGNGVQTIFTLSTTPVNNDSVFVFIGGSIVTNYNVSGTSLIFTSAPTSGTNNILAIVASTVSALAPSDNSVSTAKLQDSSVTTTKIADSQVTGMKIANNTITGVKITSSTITSTNLQDGAVTNSKLASNAVTTAKITDGAITSIKLASVTSANTVGSTSEIPVITYNAAGQITSVTTATPQTVTVETASSDPSYTSNSATNVASTQWVRGVSPSLVKSSLNTVTAAPIYAARAWVNFNGTGANGAKTPRKSANIASVVKNSTGNYTITFTTAMPSENYSFLATTVSSTGYLSSGRVPSAPTATSFTFVSTDAGGGVADAEYINLVFFDI